MTVYTTPVLAITDGTNYSGYTAGTRYDLGVRTTANGVIGTSSAAADTLSSVVVNAGTVSYTLVPEVLTASQVTTLKPSVTGTIDLTGIPASSYVVKSIVATVRYNEGTYSGGGTTASWGANQRFYVYLDYTSSGTAERVTAFTGGLTSAVNVGSTTGTVTATASGKAFTHAELATLTFTLQYDQFSASAGAPATAICGLGDLTFSVEAIVAGTTTVSGPIGAKTTPRPLVKWTNSFNGDIRKQVAYRVKVFSQAQYTASGFSPATSTATWDSGVVTSKTTQAVVGTDLADGTYRAYVTAAEKVGSTSLYTTWAYSDFTVAAAAITAPTLTAVVDQTDGLLTLTAPATLPDGFYTYYLEVARSSDGGATWTTVSNPLRTLNRAATYRDEKMPRGVPVLYRARTVAGDSDVALATSAWTTAAAISTHATGWVLKPLGYIGGRVYDAQVQLDYGWKKEGQFADITPIGNTKALVYRGSDRSKRSALTVFARTTSEAATIEALVDLDGTVLIQAPNLDQFQVRLGALEAALARSGSNYTTVFKIDWTEVWDDAAVTVDSGITTLVVEGF